MSLSELMYGPHVLVCVRVRGAFQKKKKKKKKISSCKTKFFVVTIGLSLSPFFICEIRFTISGTVSAIHFVRSGRLLTYSLRWKICGLLFSLILHCLFLSF